MELAISLPSVGSLLPCVWKATRRPGISVVRCAIAEPSGVPAPMGQKTRYKDGLFEKAFMFLFSRKMEKFASGGGKSSSSSNRAFWDWDYESFVDVSKRVMSGRNRRQQQEVVREVLLSMLPPGAPAQAIRFLLDHHPIALKELGSIQEEIAFTKGEFFLNVVLVAALLGKFRKLFPPSRWAAEFNAVLTVPFFHWLVGPSEVVEVEVNGVKQKSGVLIKKCRYLENSGCAGMCVNMCKFPTQDFFTNEFGLPLTMTPNFEDMSCQMVYGQAPPLFEEDPVSKQPCYPSICSMANPNSAVCPKLEI